MLQLLTPILLLMSMNTFQIYDFNKESDLSSWMVVDDVVMGGRSDGNLVIDSDGNGVFKGDVSLENNGGFSSIRCRFGQTDVSKYSKMVIRLKGDGKQYQVRVKTNSEDYYSYISFMSTSGDWEIIEIPLDDMYPSFRGRKLNEPNFSGERMEEIGFLIGNKRAESFRLMFDWIELR